MLISKVYPQLSELSILTIVLRLAIAAICGGIVGLQRDKAGRPAGLRTHMLVCVGAALSMLVGQYTFELYSMGDPARIASQVISGIGFLGAGTIIVTGRQRITGLTTAAGLWASAAVGISVGIGLYEAALIGCLMIFIIETFIKTFDVSNYKNRMVTSIYCQIKDISVISYIVNEIEKRGFNLESIEKSIDGGTAAVFVFTYKDKEGLEELICDLSANTDIILVREVKAS